ncbi:hypothetical protein ADUPG1_005843, partial [Aduncisulcus paluster]
MNNVPTGFLSLSFFSVCVHGALSFSTGYLRQDCLNKFAETHVNNTQKKRHDYDKDQDGGK